MAGFDSFVFFQVFCHRAQIRSVCFYSSSLESCPDLISSFFLGSPASRPDSIPSFCFWFCGIVAGFDSFVFFWVLWHHAQIRSIYFYSVSLTLCPYSITSFCSGFSGIVPRFDPYLSFWVLIHARIRSLHFVSGSPTLHPDSISSSFFGFSDIAHGFNPLVLFRVLSHCS